MRRESSDERLLKIIEGKTESRGMSNVGIRNKSVKSPGLPHVKLAFDLAMANKLLIAVGVCATGFFLVAANGRLFVSDTEIFFAPVTNASAAPIRADVARNKAVSWKPYADAFDRRHLFLPAGKKPVVQQEVEKTINVEELFKDFKLVGVIWSANPEVMIESAKEQRTVLLKKGETFSASNIRVKEIAKNAVTLQVDAGGGNQVEYQLR
jgi:hypothetical protein